MLKISSISAFLNPNNWADKKKFPWPIIFILLFNVMFLLVISENAIIADSHKTQLSNSFKIYISNSQPQNLPRPGVWETLSLSVHKTVLWKRNCIIFVTIRSVPYRYIDFFLQIICCAMLNFNSCEGTLSYLIKKWMNKLYSITQCKFINLWDIYSKESWICQISLDTALTESYLIHLLFASGNHFRFKANAQA